MGVQRTPFVFNVADLLGSHAAPRAVHVEAVVDWGLDLIRVSDEVPIVADIMLHPVSGGIAATGSVSFVTKDTCHRCLSETTTERTASIAALFDRAQDDETYDLDGSDIDLEQMLRDEVLLSLPVVTTCTDTCTGVVDSAQNDLNTGAWDHEDQSRSPFAGLKDLLESKD